jgi:hypothetical protein
MHSNLSINNTTYSNTATIIKQQIAAALANLPPFYLLLVRTMPLITKGNEELEIRKIDLKREIIKIRKEY